MFSSISIPQPNKQTDLDSDSTPRNDSLDINRSFFGRGMLPAPRKIQDPPAASPVRKKRGKTQTINIFTREKSRNIKSDDDKMDITNSRFPGNTGMSIYDNGNSSDTYASSSDLMDDFPPPFRNSVKNLSESNNRVINIDQSIDRTSNEDETAKTIKLVPPFINIFLPRARPHAETYIENIRRYSVKIVKPTELWVAAFEDRPRLSTDFEEIKMLGEGHFSVVSCVRHRLDGSLYAVKKLREKILSDKQYLFMLREVNALSALSGCEFILQYYGCWVSDGYLHMQTELCHLGSLEDLIAPYPSSFSVMLKANLTPFQGSDNKNSNQNGSNSDSNLSQSNQDTDSGNVSLGKSRSSENSLLKSVEVDTSLKSFSFNQQRRGIAEDVAWLCLQDLCIALDFMHKKGMVHMDLRPANFFLTTNAEVKDDVYHFVNGSTPQMEEDFIRSSVEARIVQRLYSIRLGDFGHCSRTDDRANVLEGENRYFAKELFNNDLSSVDLTKADMFSLGASIYELCLGKFLSLSDPVTHSECDLTVPSSLVESAAPAWAIGEDSRSAQMKEDSFEFDCSSEWQRLRAGVLDKKVEASYSTSLVEVLKLLMHPDPARRPSAQHCKDQLLRDSYVGTNSNIIFRNVLSFTAASTTSSPLRRRADDRDSGESEKRENDDEKDRIIRRLMAENAELKLKSVRHIDDGNGCI